MQHPNPGSPEAQALGCTCPILDNNYGAGSGWGPDKWWITEGCPVHTGKEQKPSADS